jgi:hypothetical protein
VCDLDYPVASRITIDVIQMQHCEKVVLRAGEITCEIGEIDDLGGDDYMPQRDGVRLPGGVMSWEKAFRSLFGTTAALDEISMIASVVRKLTKENQGC